MTKWREIEFMPHSRTYRWRCHSVRDDGYPGALEVEYRDDGTDEWRELGNTNLLDLFRVGFRAGRHSVDGEQEELFG